MFQWLRRRRMSESARRRLMIALARAEENVVETHVKNVLRVHESVSDELSLDRVLEIYLDAVDPGEPHASIIERRVLARLEGGSGGRPRRGRRLRIEGEE